MATLQLYASSSFAKETQQLLSRGTLHSARFTGAGVVLAGAVQAERPTDNAPLAGAVAPLLA